MSKSKSKYTYKAKAKDAVNIFFDYPRAKQLLSAGKADKQQLIFL